MAAGDVAFSGYLSQTVTPTLKEKVRNGLVRDGIQELNKEKAEKAEKKAQDKLNEANWIIQKNRYKVGRKETITEIVSNWMLLWKEENKKKVERRQLPDKINLQNDLESITKEYDQKRDESATESITVFE